MTGDEWYAAPCRAMQRPVEPAGAKLIWTRGGDGSHWEGCYDTHWDCAIATLRRALDDMVSAIDNGWGTNAPYPAKRLDRAIEIYDATEEKHDDRT